MTMEAWIALGGLAFSAFGGFIAVARWGAKTDGRLIALEEDVSECKAEGREIHHSLDILKQGVVELLVHEGLRKPGQGINGE